MAYNSAGPGPESERFLERTFKLRPQKPPTAVQVGNFILCRLYIRILIIPILIKNKRL